MKKIVVPILIIAFYFAFQEQSKPKPNLFITAGTVAVFMFGMMKLMAKVPSKKPEDKNGIL